MKIVDIFALQNSNNSLFTAVFNTSKESAYDDFYETYRDISFLENYFEGHKEDLQRLHPGIAVSEAVLDTQDEIEDLHDYLIELANDEIESDLEDLFKPFHKDPKTTLTESKAYGVLYERSWIRLYAIRVDYNCYVITGGAIKLVRANQDEEQYLKPQMEYLQLVRNYLLEQNIGTTEDLIDLKQE